MVEIAGIYCNKENVSDMRIMFFFFGLDLLGPGAWSRKWKILNGKKNNLFNLIDQSYVNNSCYLSNRYWEEGNGQAH